LFPLFTQLAIALQHAVHTLLRLKKVIHLGAPLVGDHKDNVILATLLRPQVPGGAEALPLGSDKDSLGMSCQGREDQGANDE